MTPVTTTGRHDRISLKDKTEIRTTWRIIASIIVATACVCGLFLTIKADIRVLGTEVQGIARELDRQDRRITRIEHLSPWIPVAPK